VIRVTDEDEAPLVDQLTDNLVRCVDLYPELRGSAPSAPLVARLLAVWAAADAAFERDEDPAGRPLAAKWVCRRMWDDLVAAEVAVPKGLRGLLVRAGVWGLGDAVTSVVIASSAQDPERSARRDLEWGLRELAETLEIAALPALRQAALELGVPLEGRLAVTLVRRLVAAGEIAEAVRAAGLASSSTYTAVVLESLSPFLDAEAREQAVAAAWESARRDRGLGTYADAAACADWAALLPFSSPEHRRLRVEQLVAAVTALPDEMYEPSQDWEDLRGLAAIALLGVGERATARAWIDRAPPETRAWVLADVLPHLDLPRQEACALEALELLRADLASGYLLLARLAPVSTLVATRCLDAAGTLSAPEDQVRAVVEMLPVLPLDLAEVALSGIEDRIGAEDLRRLLRALVERPAAARLGERARRILDHALAHPTVDLLEALAALVPPERAAALLQAMPLLAEAAVADREGVSILRALATLVDRAPPLHDHHRDLLTALTRSAMDDLDEVPEAIPLVDPVELEALARRRLLERRAMRRPRPGGLVYDLCRTGGLIRAPGDLVIRLAPPEKRALARALVDAGPWGRTALLSRVEMWWPSLVQGLLDPDRERPIDLDEAACVEASRLGTPEALFAWIEAHPPLHVERAVGRLGAQGQRTLRAALEALPTVPAWAEELLDGIRTAPATSWERYDLGERDTLLRLDEFIDTHCAGDRGHHGHAALRWALFGDHERALRALQRAHPMPRGDTPPSRAEVVLGALRSLQKDRVESRSGAPAPAAPDPEFLPDLLVLLQAEPDPSARVVLLSLLADRRPCRGLSSALEAEVEALMAAGGPVHDDACGRVALHLSPAARLRSWGWAFSAARRHHPLPFGWASHSAVEVAASLRDGHVEDLVAWAARLSHGPER
jgi:hypothetical protein